MEYHPIRAMLSQWILYTDVALILHTAKVRALLRAMTNERTPYTDVVPVVHKIHTPMGSITLMDIGKSLHQNQKDGRHHCTSQHQQPRLHV